MVFMVCAKKGTVNKIHVNDMLDKLAVRMMNTFERYGFKFVDYVSGETEKVYTIEWR